MIPETEALERILALEKLSHLKIVVTKPNPEDMTDEYRQIMKKLGDQKASSQTLEYQKAPGAKRLEPDEETRKLAEIAAFNGYVQGKERGRAADSTKSHPKSVTLEVGKDESVFVRFLNAIRTFQTMDKSSDGDG